MKTTPKPSHALKRSKRADVLQEIGGTIGPIINIQNSNHKMIGRPRDVSTATRHLPIRTIPLKPPYKKKSNSPTIHSTRNPSNLKPPYKKQSNSPFFAQGKCDQGLKPPCKKSPVRPEGFTLSNKHSNFFSSPYKIDRYYFLPSSFFKFRKLLSRKHSRKTTEKSL